MIDGYKILNLPVNIDELLNNNLLSFPLQFDEDSAEILNKPRHAEYFGQLFTIKNNNAKLKGSFHKYHNSGLHNHNDFYFNDLKNVEFDVCNKFRFNAEETELNNLEFGVNILIPIAPKEFLRYVINHKGTPFQKFNIQGAIGIECRHSQFIIKIYDKGHQYNIPGNLLRFEIKVISMTYLSGKEVNISTLADLLNLNELYKLKRILTTVFNEILIYDYSINETILNDTERLILSNGNNPKFWENLLPDSNDFVGRNNNPEYKRRRKKYYRELSKFKKLICKYSTSTLQKDISLLIEKKCTQLLYDDNKKGDKLTDIIIPQKTTEKGQINISNIVLDCPIPIRICLTCGKDISHKKKGAKFCKKKCRNKYTNPLLNPRNNLLRRLEKIQSYPLLFDVSQCIELTIQQRELINTPNSIYSGLLINEFAHSDLKQTNCKRQ
jgi:hypothetical protein